MAIYKTYLSREFDATNIIRTPLIIAIILVAIDHVSLLGLTI